MMPTIQATSRNSRIVATITLQISPYVFSQLSTLLIIAPKNGSSSAGKLGRNALGLSGSSGTG